MKRFVFSLNGTPRLLHHEMAGAKFTLDGEEFSAAVSRIAPEQFSVLVDDLSLDVRVAPVESAEGPARYLVHVDGEEFLIEVADPRQWRRGGGGAQLEGAQRVTAPMPGRVVRLLVAEGQAVAAGQGLAVVEAMKMQNEIRSPKAGRVGRLSAAEGQTVAAGQALLVIE